MRDDTAAQQRNGHRVEAAELDALHRATVPHVEVLGLEAGYWFAA